MEQMNLAEKIEKSFTAGCNGHIYHSVIRDTEKYLIEKILRKTHGNQILAARILGINRNTLRSKIQKLQIRMERFKI